MMQAAGPSSETLQTVNSPALQSPPSAPLTVFERVRKIPRASHRILRAAEVGDYHQLVNALRLAQEEISDPSIATPLWDIGDIVGVTPLMHASGRGEPTLVGLLLKQPRVDLAKTDSRGETALGRALRKAGENTHLQVNYATVVQQLLQAQAVATPEQHPLIRELLNPSNDPTKSTAVERLLRTTAVLTQATTSESITVFENSAPRGLPQGNRARI